MKIYIVWEASVTKNNKKIVKMFSDKKKAELLVEETCDDGEYRTWFTEHEVEE